MGSSSEPPSWLVLKCVVCGIFPMTSELSLMYPTKTPIPKNLELLERRLALLHARQKSCRNILGLEHGRVPDASVPQVCDALVTVTLNRLEKDDILSATE